MASARGGFYAGTAFEEMDFQEQFLRKFLGFLGISNVVFVRAEAMMTLFSPARPTGPVGV
ncbi:hypothetical protein [Enterobacter cloacae]|uniref:hypothetical protein n=1 Tax=Enterobacter cloacae TaxID=550 RepID=UPI003F628A74